MQALLLITLFVTVVSAGWSRQCYSVFNACSWAYYSKDWQTIQGSPLHQQFHRLTYENPHHWTWIRWIRTILLPVLAVPSTYWLFIICFPHLTVILWDGSDLACILSSIYRPYKLLDFLFTSLLFMYFGSWTCVSWYTIAYKVFNLFVLVTCLAADQYCVHIGGGTRRSVQGTCCLCAAEYQPYQGIIQFLKLPITYISVL